MPIELTRLLAFEGPNIRGPQPGVLLEARCDRDRSLALRTALKDAAQSVGVVIGALESRAEASGASFVLAAGFVTPTPALGALVARYVVEGLNAREAGDEAWDADGRLWELQKLRRAQALPLAALQLLAAAQARGIPAFVRADGALQLGYGSRSWTADTAGLGETAAGPAFGGAAEVAPWERIGAIPIVAVTGGAGQQARIVAEIVAGLGARGLTAAGGAELSFAGARALLEDGAAAAAVMGLEAGDLLRRGLAFERCAAAVVLDLPAELPPEAANRAELAQALCLPALVSGPGGLALLDVRAAEIGALVRYAPGRVGLVDSAGGPAQIVARVVEQVAGA